MGTPPLELIEALGVSPTVNAQPDDCEGDELGDVGPLLSLQPTYRPSAADTQSHARILVIPRISRRVYMDAAKGQRPEESS